MEKYHRLLRFGVSCGWPLGCGDLGQSEAFGIPECEWAVEEHKLLQT